MTWLKSNNSKLMQDQISTVERRDDAVFLTLTRTSTLSITTAGVIVTWQEEIDSGGNMTWSGSSITLPMSGYYMISVVGSLASRDNFHGDLRINSVDVCSMGVGALRDVKFMHSVTRFFKAGDVVQYKATTTTGTHTLAVVTEDGAGESPILHMVLL